MIEQETTIFPSALNTHIILIVGNSRSGTTMMGRVLGNHRSVFTFNELHFFEELWSPQENRLSQSLHFEQAVLLVARLFAIQRNDYFHQGNTQDYIDEAREVIESLPDPVTPPRVFEAFLKYEAGQHGKSIVCLQTPRNVYYLKEILALYPKAYVVNMIRDPRDILLSQKKRWQGRFSGPRKIPLKHIIRTWADYHPITISLLWRSGIRAGDCFAHHPRIFQARFESLVETPEEILRDMCALVELEFQSEMLNVPHVGSSNRPDQPDQRGIDPSVTSRWKQGGLSATEIYICQKMTEQSMMRHRYIVETVWPNPLVLLYHGVIWGLKIGLVLLLNMNRVRNLVPAVRKRLMK